MALQPRGPVLVAGAWACVVRPLVGRRTGRWVNLRLVVTRGGWWFIALVLGALTVRQQLHVDLLL